MPIQRFTLSSRRRVLIRATKKNPAVFFALHFRSLAPIPDSPTVTIMAGSEIIAILRPLPSETTACFRTFYITRNISAWSKGGLSELVIETKT